jgi:hypothetical protein
VDGVLVSSQITPAPNESTDPNPSFTVLYGLQWTGGGCDTVQVLVSASGYIGSIMLVNATATVCNGQTVPIYLTI